MAVRIRGGEKNDSRVILYEFDCNEIDISGAQNGVVCSIGHLSSVLEERAFVDI